MLRPSILVFGAALMSSAPVQGQGKIPPGQLPPAGLCRVWLDGVPPGRQPAVTDCATAVRTRPRGARVIFGDDYARKGKQGVSRNGGVLGVILDPRRGDPCYAWDPRCDQRGTVINSRDGRDQPCYAWDPRCTTTNGRVVNPRDRANDCYAWDPRCTQSSRDRTIDARERARREAVLRAERGRYDRDRRGNDRSDWCRDRDHNGRCDYRGGRR